MAPFEALYRQRCRTSLCWYETGETVSLVTGVGRALKSQKLSLKQYVPDPSHVIDLDSVQVREDLSYDVHPVRIADHRVKQLKGKEISLVKVIWSSSDEGDATCETESRMRELYLELFV
ncbi:uncharacterized protein LOC113862313 [Abrus precatorius]|uniref:Uncharacterized protein LOC113862313 n=1 Tax=Abrus precatorius TaxID=3816 RepID=A0A8B8L4T4_ABRPR|nr:uncharacterized protein LOC113862313 [Abrus precatorius]